MLLSTIFESRSLENPSTPISDYDGEWNGLPFEKSASGVHVSRDSAMRHHAIWRGVDLISDWLAKVPLVTYKRVGTGKNPDPDHPAYSLLLHEPNAEMDAYVWRKTMEVHRLLHGNAYSIIRRLGSAAPYELVLVNPDDTWPVRINGLLWYVNRSAGELVKVPARDMIHLKGMGFDGLVGYSVIHSARETIGYGLAMVEYSGRFFRNNAVPSVVIEMPNQMPPDMRAQFIREWEHMHQGLTNSHRTAILTNGGKVNQISIPAKDAMLIDQQRFTLVMIANLFGLPPHKLGDSSKVAYNSLEQENQSFSDDGLEGRYVSCEKEFRKKLLTEKEKREDSHLIEYDRSALVRGDSAARANYFKTALNGKSWMLPNEVRHLENMNPIDGLDDQPESTNPAPGDGPDSNPTQSGPGTNVDNGNDPQSAPGSQSTGSSDLARSDAISGLKHACRRMATRIGKTVVSSAKTPAKLLSAVESLEASHQLSLVDAFTHPLRAVRHCAGIEETPEHLAAKLILAASKELLRISSETHARGIEGALAEWSKRFTTDVADRIADEVFLVDEGRAAA